MDVKETSEYMQLIDEALELLSEKRECLSKVFKGTAGKKRKVYLQRVEEIDVLLKENSQHLRAFDFLEKEALKG